MTEQRLNNKSRYISFMIIVIVAAVYCFYLKNIKMGEQDLVVHDFNDLEVEIRQNAGRCYPGHCGGRSIKVSGDGEIVSSSQYQNNSNQIIGRLTDDDLQELATVLDHYGFFSLKEGEFCTMPIPDVGDLYMRIKLNGLERETIICNKQWPDSNGDKLVNKVDFILSDFLLRTIDGNKRINQSE